MSDTNKPGEPSDFKSTKPQPPPKPEPRPGETKLRPDLSVRQQEWRERISKTVARLLGRRPK
jgi:hypothetical protein